MDDGLKRIVLLDSYIPSERIEIRLDGHTIISGENGKGKTSLLRLIPLFYGVRPGSLIKKGDGGNANFVTYYLPRAGSYVVYEYHAHGRVMLSVFTSMPSNPDSVRRVLIDSPYRADLFYDTETNLPHQSDSLISRANSLTLTHYTCKNTNDYKQQLLESGFGPYSIASRGNKLNLLVPLLANMFERKASFSDLAKVAQEWSMQVFDADQQQVLKDFTINKSDLQKTVHDYRALSGLDRLKDQVPVIKGSAADIRHLDEDMAAIYQLAKEGISELALNNADLEKLFLARDGEVTTQKEAMSVKISEQQSIVDVCDDARLKTATAVSNLQRSHELYVDDGVPGYESEIQLVEGKEVELARLKNQLKMKMTLLRILSARLIGSVQILMPMQRLILNY